MTIMRRVGVAALALVAGLGLTLGLGAAEPENPADLVLLGGNIVTVSKAMPKAQALAVRGDRIVAIGDDASVKKLVGSKTQVLELGGKLTVPGLIESHAHFMSLGYSLMRLDLTTASNFDDIVAQVGEAAAKAEPGEWILGRGWHQEKWNKTPEPNVDGLPIHTALSEVSPDNPVFLSHASGHSAMANAKAMELAGVTKSTPDPDGGEIVHDAAGEPIGVFRETAQGLLGKARQAAEEGRTPEQVLAEQKKAAALAAERCLSWGITTFHDAGVSFETVDFFKQLVDAGELPLRLYVMLSEDNAALAEKMDEYRMIGYGDNRLTVRTIKRLIDGALGSHGAWLLEPYDSRPSSTGLNTEPIDAMKEVAQLAVEHDFQVATHAIGDRGNRETLDIYEEALKPTGDSAARRWRIEHAQHIHPDDLPRFAELGVLAAMQGVHCTSDGPWVFKRLGAERAEAGAYMWRTLLDSGARISNGTDAPVERVDPMANFYASVARRMANGKVFFGDQKMTRQEALHSYTMAGAYVGFEEELKGSLEVGKLADIAVLSQDLLTVPEEQIPATKAVYTIVGGKIVYQK